MLTKSWAVIPAEESISLVEASSGSNRSPIHDVGNVQKIGGEQQL